MCNEGIVGGRDKAGDGIASDWDCEAVRAEIRLFCSNKIILTHKSEDYDILNNVSYMLYFYFAIIFAIPCFLQIHLGHELCCQAPTKSDSSTRVIGAAHNRKCRALFRIFELLTHGFCVSKVLFEINFVTI